MPKSKASIAKRRKIKKKAHAKNGKNNKTDAKLDVNNSQKPTKSDQLDTIFLRNLSFETEEDNLKEYVENNFGPTAYSLICRDKETDESKGTAFVKFKNPDDVKKCLKEFKDKELQHKFHLDGRNLMVFPSLSKDQVQNIKKDDNSGKDKRNLALSREGYIHPMSDEAKELSKGDLEKRKILNQRKKDLLNNLHNFVSDVRLCIHNLPPNVDDDRLRKLFQDKLKDQHPTAKIVECRVMRNKKGSGKLGTSKGFGFVAFGKHEHALAALKAFNNNPSIFARDKRPIVEFSIENLVALNKKKTRLVNSQRKLKSMKTNEIKTE